MCLDLGVYDFGCDDTGTFRLCSTKLLQTSVTSCVFVPAAAQSKSGNTAYTCTAGAGATKIQINSGDKSSKVLCQAWCEAEPQCVAFDYHTSGSSSREACRLFRGLSPESPQTTLNRAFCVKARATPFGTDACVLAKNDKCDEGAGGGCLAGSDCTDCGTCGGSRPPSLA